MALEFRYLPSAWPNAVSVISRLCLIRPIGQCRPHDPDSFACSLIAAAFLLAGFIKGVLGLGLPTVAMGLLAVTMPPGQAIAIVIVPAIVTNIWQTFVGRYLRDIMRRLWPLMVGTVIGIWLNGGLLTGPYAPYGTVIARRAAGGLRHRRPEQIQLQGRAPRRKWIGGIVGLDDRRGFGRHRRAGHPVDAVHAGDRHGEGRTGAGARRVLHRRDAWRSPSTSPTSGLLTAATALPGAVAMAASFAGMFIGQAVRSRMQPDVFRRWFLIAMILLGLYLAGNALVKSGMPDWRLTPRFRERWFHLAHAGRRHRTC